jgi:uncharacterized protein YecE (DUF72 family)
MYAQRLPAVEIASTYTRLPSPDLFATWSEAVPPGFEFCLKAPQRIGQELAAGKPAARSMAGFLDLAGMLGQHLGPVLVQVPEHAKADRHALSAFLAALPEEVRVAFDFRHPSWHDDATLRLLSEHEAALVLSDAGEGSPKLTITAGFTYVRLRHDEDRAEEGIREWAERLGLLARRGVEVYAFVKQDRKGAAVDRAMRLASLLRTESQLGEQAMLS